MTIAVVGLGYVGLPLAVEFGKNDRTIGFDISVTKVHSIMDYRDPNGELTRDELIAARWLECTTAPRWLLEADFIIVCVPTPVDKANQPQLEPLISACKTIGMYLKPGAIVVFESTVYPGVTEEECVPVLEQYSGKRWKKDFFVGYSPERINPGDKVNTLTTVKKVVSGDTPETLDTIAAMYSLIIKAGVHKAPSIKVAEMSKVIENTQRDVNIAIMNEVALICHHENIDTHDVLDAAGTKWNFLKFQPGLVGGHCIGVDPYYLSYRAEIMGYTPQVITASRRINNLIGKFVADEIVAKLIHADIPVKGAVVNILGFTFKENCADIRNSKVIDLVNELQRFGVTGRVFDPLADRQQVLSEYGLSILGDWNKMPTRADAIVFAVAHDTIVSEAYDMIEFMRKEKTIVFDVKAKLDRERLQSQGLEVWRL